MTQAGVTMRQSVPRDHPPPMANMTHSHASETQLQQSSREIRAGGLELSDRGSGIRVITHWHTGAFTCCVLNLKRKLMTPVLSAVLTEDEPDAVDSSSARKGGIIVMRVLTFRVPLFFTRAPAAATATGCSPVVSQVLGFTRLPLMTDGLDLLSLQVRWMRRCVPCRVSAESSAVSSLRSPGTPPQEAVVLPLGRWRRLLPAVPRHLRTHKHAAKGEDRWLRWTKCPDEGQRVREGLQDGAADATSGWCSRLYPPNSWRAAAAGWQDRIKCHHLSTQFLVPQPQQAKSALIIGWISFWRSFILFHCPFIVRLQLFST